MHGVLPPAVPPGIERLGAREGHQLGTDRGALRAQRPDCVEAKVGAPQRAQRAAAQGVGL